VIRTRVGYAGGAKENPTYHNLGDHTETLQIDYDPSKVSYEKLLELFWEEHDPTSRSWSRQYKAVVFYHDEEQKRLAGESRARLAARIGKTVHTEVLPYSRFYAAEDYHQKYYLRGHRQILKQFQQHYPQAADLMSSTAAARVNGYLGGYGTSASFKADIDRLGLSEAAREELLERVGNKE
jgi:peptide-methionine (S)-S-oxide reductase